MSDADEGSGPLPAKRSVARRRWSEAEKRRIVAESHQSGVSVSAVARRHNVNPKLIFNWRRQFRERGSFLPVVVEPDAMPASPDAGCSAVPANGQIVIVLMDGSRVIVDSEVDGVALERVLSVLAQR